MGVESRIAHELPNKTGAFTDFLKKEEFILKQENTIKNIRFPNITEKSLYSCKSSIILLLKQVSLK